MLLGMDLDLEKTLAELVAIPSVNPMGRTVAVPEFYEYKLTDYLERAFGRLGLKTHRQPVAPLRDNLLARLEGRPTPEEGGSLILFEVHQDTVPVDGMTIEPWTPMIRDGRLYGRGSCDVKGGMAAMLGAVARLAAETPENRPTVVMACTVNEEYGFTGATNLCQTWSDHSSPLLPRRPDAAIVAEPTSLDIVVAHKGVARWRCHTHGRAAHSSRPEAGDNAIYRMARVVAALERFHAQVLGDRPPHPLCGPPTLSVGTIAGGISVNTVPDHCTIEIDRRLLPGEDPAAAQREVIDFVANALHDPKSASLVEHEPLLIQSTGLAETGNHDLAERLATATRTVVGRAKKIGVPFGTDAAAYSRAGVPTVVFGPGSIEQAHTADEWISLEEVRLASEILYCFVRA